MDLQMPEMNGFEATEYIRNTLHSKIPIIALTADVTTVDLAKCRAVGMNDYIAKPIDEKLLFNKIVELVKNPVPLGDFIDMETDDVENKKAPIINLEYLKLRTKSNPALMTEMISLYLQQTPPLIKAMKKGLLEKDWKSLQAAVHKMIPSFSIMGISKDFENLVKEVQEYVGTEKHTGKLTYMVLQIENVCVQAIKELKEEFNRIKNVKSQ
jgi:CheY-like chemotaxis protein